MNINEAVRPTVPSLELIQIILCGFHYSIFYSKELSFS